MGRPEVLGDGEERADLECGPRAKRAWGHRTVGWGGCGGDDSVERLPTVSGQQAPLSGGGTSSKLPHTHVCMCTHTHTHGCITHTCVHTQRHMQSTDIHTTDAERHTCTQIHRRTHRLSSHLQDTGTHSPSPTQPLRDNAFCPSLSRPGPPAPPGRARPGAGVTEAKGAPCRSAPAQS